MNRHRHRRARRYRAGPVVVLLAAVVAALLVSGAAPRSPVRAGSDAPAAVAPVARQVDRAGTFPLHVGPMYPERWRPGPGNHINLCVNNRSSLPFQVANNYWSTAQDLTLTYEPGPFGCDLWPTNRRIDVHDGAGGNCVYFYVLADQEDFYSRAIVYRSVAPSQADCWDSTIEQNHASSKGLGVALGLVVFDNPGPDVHVMNRNSWTTVSWPQPPDLDTFDFFY